ncbi:hypothetical protein HID58_046846 [Brassica napus]|uniref:D-isomer specific 2-hydroxyacid dehydrogenase NAD-binding domain-containing protein n=1 Tax=Brassica napus TaxID=3708 RepID=A0ABQ8AYL5_BRANA|nr:hypothetical protein HID58_046846 [Brassica napus]
METSFVYGKGISLHPVLDKTTYHLVNKERLAMMKKVTLVEGDHLRESQMFRVGLDVFEEEPFHETRLADMKNAIVVPHIASAFKVTN